MLDVGTVFDGISAFLENVQQRRKREAGIWVAAGIGMAVASGLYAIGVATTALSLVGLEVLGWVFRERRSAIAEEGGGGNFTNAVP